MGGKGILDFLRALTEKNMSCSLIDKLANSLVFQLMLFGLYMRLVTVHHGDGVGVSAIAMEWTSPLHLCHLLAASGLVPIDAIMMN